MVAIHKALIIVGMLCTSPLMSSCSEEGGHLQLADAGVSRHRKKDVVHESAAATSPMFPCLLEGMAVRMRRALREAAAENVTFGGPGAWRETCAGDSWKGASVGGTFSAEPWRGVIGNDPPDDGTPRERDSKAKFWRGAETSLFSGGDASRAEGSESGSVVEEMRGDGASQTSGGAKRSVILLKDVFINEHGGVFNATHVFHFTRKSGETSWGKNQIQRLSSYGPRTRVVKVDTVVNLAFGGSTSARHHRFMEVALKLPLFVRLHALMPRLKGARFLLDHHEKIQESLSHILGISPVHHLRLPVGDELISAKEMIWPVAPARTPDISTWRLLRRGFFLKEGNIPLFRSDWSLRMTWQDLIKVTEEFHPSAFPGDWVVLVAELPASLAVDPTGRPEIWFETLFLPFLSVASMTRNDFWVDRVHVITDIGQKAVALARRAVALVTAPGAALDLLPYMPPGATLVLLEPRLVSGAPEADSLASLPREIQDLGQAVRALAFASDVHLAAVPCTLDRSQMPGNTFSDVFVSEGNGARRCPGKRQPGRGCSSALVCGQHQLQAALDWAASRAFHSPLMPGVHRRCTAGKPLASHSLERQIADCRLETVRVPGSRVTSLADARRLRRWGRCVAERGSWVVDPTPRRLPWVHPIWGDAGVCDADFLTGSEADAVVASGNAATWHVRPGLKYRWHVAAEDCGDLLGGSSSSSSSFTKQMALDAPGSLADDGGAIPGTGGAFGGPHAEGDRDGVLGVTRGAGDVSGHYSAEEQSTGVPRRGAEEVHLWKAFDPQGMCRVLGDRRHVAFIGDSLTDELALAFLFNMLRDAEKPWDKPKRSFQREIPKDCAAWLTGTNQALTHRWCWSISLPDVCPQGLTISYMRNNFLRVEVEDIPQFVKGFYVPWATVMRPTLASADVIVINRGAHYAHKYRYERELRATLRTLRYLYPDKLILFRDTPAGHPNCTVNNHPLVDLPRGRQPEKSTKPLPFGWGEFQEQNRVARTLVEAMGVAYVDVSTMTAFRVDGHRGTRKKKTDGSIVFDCLHYCLPGPVDGWVEAIYNHLIQLS